jgi:uncharacterized protein
VAGQLHRVMLMRWNEGHRSRNVIDRRGQRSAGAGGGMLALLPLLLRSRGGWVVALVMVGMMVVGGGYLGSGTDRAVDTPVAGGRGDDRKVQFVSFVLDDVQRTWATQMSERGKTYEEAKLVVFTGRTATACGQGRAATGPFYCPSDKRAYIDLSFYDELKNRLGARGDFAEAYVIAHEIGHHVQNLLGTSSRVHRASPGAQRGEHGLSVRLELQADCYAGMWAHSTEQRALLESGDLEEALGAAAAIGDDRLQRTGTGTVQPESWTHGSSEQRARWFRRGFDEGDMDACDTFGSNVL